MRFVSRISIVKVLRIVLELTEKHTVALFVLEVKKANQTLLKKGVHDRKYNG